MNTNIGLALLANNATTVAWVVTIWLCVIILAASSVSFFLYIHTRGQKKTTTGDTASGQDGDREVKQYLGKIGTVTKPIGPGGPGEVRIWRGVYPCLIPARSVSGDHIPAKINVVITGVKRDDSGEICLVRFATDDDFNALSSVSALAKSDQS